MIESNDNYILDIELSSASNTVETNIEGKGDPGPKGDDGITYIPEIEKVETLSPQEQANVSVRIEEDKMLFSFYLPRGQTGVSNGDMTKAVYDKDHDNVIDNAKVAEYVGNISSANLLQTINLVNELDDICDSLRIDLNLNNQRITDLSDSIEKIPVGTLSQYAGLSAPSGWLICDGSEISRTNFSNLFSVIGTTYGSGDGETTFNIPDIRNVTVVGLDARDDTFNSLGKKVGAKTHKLTNLEMPPTALQYGIQAVSGLADGTAWSPQGVGSIDASNQKSFDIIQPSIVMNYIIKY